MSVTIEIPLNHFDSFVGRCDPVSDDCAVLKTGVIIRRPKADHFERVVEIRCTIEEARELLNAAAFFYPDVLTYIQDALATALDS